MTIAHWPSRLMGLLHFLGVKSGLSHFFNMVPGPVKLLPGRCISKGKLFIALLNNDPPSCALINCFLVALHITHVPRFMFLPFLVTTNSTPNVSVVFLHLTQYILLLYKIIIFYIKKWEFRVYPGTK